MIESDIIGIARPVERVLESLDAGVFWFQLSLSRVRESD